jgi:hypothetical protein
MTMKPVMLAALLLGAAALGATPAGAAVEPAIQVQVGSPPLGFSAAAEALDRPAVTLACVDSSCVGTPTGCAAVSATLGGTCANGQPKCRSDWWRHQTWEVEGQHSGDGAVEFYTECGERKVAVCDTIKLPHCASDEPGSGDGDLGCFYRILHGNPKDIAGRCIDPVDPAIAYEAVPIGTPFVAAERLLSA